MIRGRALGPATSRVPMFDLSLFALTTALLKKTRMTSRQSVDRTDHIGMFFLALIDFTDSLLVT